MNLSSGEIKGLKRAVSMLRSHIRHYETLPHDCNAATAVESMAVRIEDLYAIKKKCERCGMGFNAARRNARFCCKKCIRENANSRRSKKN